MSRLAKSINTMRSAINARRGGDDELKKGVHDAMYHHALHAAAALRAPYKEASTPGTQTEAEKAAAQHTFMFLRHALENARKKAASSMIWSMQRAIEFYRTEASDQVYAQKKHPACVHFEESGGFVPHADDGNLKEDYGGKKSK